MRIWILDNLVPRVSQSRTPGIYVLLIAFRTTYTIRNQEFQSLLANVSWHSRSQTSQSEMFGKIIKLKRLLVLPSLQSRMFFIFCQTVNWYQLPVAVSSSQTWTLLIQSCNVYLTDCIINIYHARVNMKKILEPAPRFEKLHPSLKLNDLLQNIWRIEITFDLRHGCWFCWSF